MASAFIGREYELEELNRLYETGTFQFPVIYGRRRVGKTALIEQFVRKLPAIYFTAVEGDARMNLRNLSRELYAFEHPDVVDPEAVPVFSDFYAAFEAIFALAQSKRVVFVIDEYPYLAKAEPAISSYLQALIDKNKDASRLFLILCGSSLSFMKEEVLDEKSPLYGRRTAQFEIKPFDFFDSMRFVPGMDPQDAAQVYGMVGGIPLYLLQFNDSLNLKENVDRVFLNPSSILYEEPSNLLKQEVQKASQYNALLSAIAEGASANNEIATAVGLSSTEITYYLKELQRIGIVQKEQPIVNSGRRAVYRISDNLFKFWYRFISPNRSTIERGIKRRAEKSITEHISDYMGSVFEDICRQWLWRAYADDRLNFEIDAMGRWWGNDPFNKQEAEIDVVCVDGNTVSAMGECKWRSGEFPRSDLQKLFDRSRLINAVPSTNYFAFSRSGFTDACKDLAAKTSCTHLITFEEMINSYLTFLQPGSN